MDKYSEAHLLVAAIRLLSHRLSSPPSIEDVCKEIDFSTEVGLSLCRYLQNLGAIDIIEDPFSIKLSIIDHLKLEDIPQLEQDTNSLADELKAFKNKKKNMDEKVAAIQQEAEKKKQDLFADIEAKLKKSLGDNKD